VCGAAAFRPEAGAGCGAQIAVRTDRGAALGSTCGAMRDAEVPLSSRQRGEGAGGAFVSHDDRWRRPPIPRVPEPHPYPPRSRGEGDYRVAPGLERTKSRATAVHAGRVRPSAVTGGPGSTCDATRDVKVPLSSRQRGEGAGGALGLQNDRWRRPPIPRVPQPHPYPPRSRGEGATASRLALRGQGLAQPPLMLGASGLRLPRMSLARPATQPGTSKSPSSRASEGRLRVGPLFQKDDRWRRPPIPRVPQPHPDPPRSRGEGGYRVAPGLGRTRSRATAVRAARVRPPAPTGEPVRQTTRSRATAVHAGRVRPSAPTDELGSTCEVVRDVKVPPLLAPARGGCGWGLVRVAPPCGDRTRPAYRGSPKHFTLPPPERGEGERSVRPDDQSQRRRRQPRPGGGPRRRQPRPGGGPPRQPGPKPGRPDDQPPRRRWPGGPMPSGPQPRPWAMAGPAAAATVTAAANAAKRFRLFIVLSLETTGPENRPRP
jgi:hypothetical protein